VVRPLTIPVLYSETSPGVVPFEGSGGTGHPAAAALQTAFVLDDYLSCLFVYGIKSPWTDAKARLELAFPAYLLANDDMCILVVLKYINTELRSRVHHILLSIKRSLSA
jgi:hypothetical protein